MKVLFLILVLAFTFSSCQRAELVSESHIVAVRPKPRLLVLTDIGGDPDDEQSLVRLLSFANEFRIEGLIASASGTPGELSVDVVRPDLIHRQIDAYAKVFSNLQVHADGYPSPEVLRSKVHAGNPRRGIGFVGEGHDTDGSRWIIRQVDDRPTEILNIAIWGGPTELAQALFRVRSDRSPEACRQFVSRLRVHAIGHQDDSGPWIVEQFPDLFYVLDVIATTPRSVSGPQIDRRGSVYRGIYLGGDESLTSASWINDNVRTRHGPLGALYPDKTWTDPNPNGAMKEGDTPSWFYFLDNGLQDARHPEWGGWGGRFVQPEPGRPLYRDSSDTVGGVTEARATVYRWRPDFQNAFAARMDWQVRPAKGANHFPIAAVDGDTTGAIILRTARPGATTILSANGSVDPDRDRLSYRWWIYGEPGTPIASSGLLQVNRAGDVATLRVPALESGSLHVILEVIDDGSPELKSYRRVVVQW